MHITNWCVGEHRRHYEFSGNTHSPRFNWAQESHRINSKEQANVQLAAPGPDQTYMISVQWVRPACVWLFIYNLLDALLSASNPFTLQCPAVYLTIHLPVWAGVLGVVPFDTAIKQTNKKIQVRFYPLGNIFGVSLFFFEDMLILFIIHLKFVESLLIENMRFLWGKQNHNFIYFIL